MFNQQKKSIFYDTFENLCKKTLNKGSKKMKNQTSLEYHM